MFLGILIIFTFSFFYYLKYINLFSSMLDGKYSNGWERINEGTVSRKSTDVNHIRKKRTTLAEIAAILALLKAT